MTYPPYPMPTAHHRALEKYVLDGYPQPIPLVIYRFLYLFAGNTYSETRNGTLSLYDFCAAEACEGYYPERTAFVKQAIGCEVLLPVGHYEGGNLLMDEKGRVYCDAGCVVIIGNTPAEAIANIHLGRSVEKIDPAKLDYTKQKCDTAGSEDQ